MNYFEWNALISDFFFNPSNAAKDVLFYLTKEDLIKLSKSKFQSLHDEDIWNDFVDAIKYGTSSGQNRISLSPIERPLQLFASWDKKDTPPFIAYLILYIIPLTESYDEPFNSTNYYGKVTSFFRRYGILNDRQAIKTANYKAISSLWDELENWTINQDFSHGIFELKKFANDNWIHVGKPLAQCVLPPSAIKKLPGFFFEAGLIPNFSYAPDEFRKHLIKLGSKTLGLKPSVIDLIRHSTQKNELGQSILDILKREYAKWTGETHQENEDERPKIKRNFTVAPLFLQFRINENTGTISFSYRMYSSNEFPEDLKFLTFENLYEGNGWSKTLNIPFAESFELTDNFNKWIARYPKRDVRIFTSGAMSQLSAAFWIETELLSRTDTMYLLCSNGLKQSIADWGKTFKSGNFAEADLDGVPEGYAMFRLINPTTGHHAIPLLSLSTEKSIELIGLRINHRTFVSSPMPEVRVKNADGTEKLILQYKNEETIFYLSRGPLINGHWILPTNLIFGLDFYIRIENETSTRSDISYSVVDARESALQIITENSSKRDSFGRRSSAKTDSYCLNNNIINPVKASQRYYSPFANLFITNKPVPDTPIGKSVFVLENSDMLSNFLSLKRNLTTEDFYQAFEFYFTQNGKAEELTSAYNLTRIKKISLNYHDYSGILDFDYETKRVTVNPPQFIFIPSQTGRKVLLVGARDSSMVESIIEIARKFHLNVSIEKQWKSNRELLLPDAVQVATSFASKKAYGENDLIFFANEIKIPLINDYFVQVALKLFSADIVEYEKELLQKHETHDTDYDWARKIFDVEKLTYAQSTGDSFDKTFALVEYKLNEYTYYNILWKQGKGYTVDKNWGKFLALKYYGRNVVLVDSQRMKVATPLETPLPKLLSKSLILLSGLAPNFQYINGRPYRVYENIPAAFSDNLFSKLGQKPTKHEIK